jgi:imidazolonepropionase-like amidohydrolase
MAKALLILLVAAIGADAREPVKALAHATLYTAPGATPIKDGVVVIEGEKIVAAGQVGKVKIPAGAEVLDCTGLTVTAGFQNSHVHLTEEKWNDAATQPAERLARQISEMLTVYGFTTVADVGSNPATTLAIRSRIESGEVAGPRIFTAGAPLYPPKGIPFYLKSAPEHLLRILLQPETAAEALKLTKANLDAGADLTKLFAGSLITPQEVKPMSIEIARAAVDETHRRGKLVFAHPSNHEGIRVILASGVDVMVHTTAGAGPWPPELISEIVRKRVSVIPTLQLWGYEMNKAGLADDIKARFVNDGVEQLRAFAKAGGDILFGTDVGYVTEYDPSEEYTLMSKAGMSPVDILASLTTAPARRFREERVRGKIAPGMQADLVVLRGDPAEDVRNFARVRYTLRKGRVIYRNE